LALIQLQIENLKLKNV